MAYGDETRDDGVGICAAYSTPVGRTWTSALAQHQFQRRKSMNRRDSLKIMAGAAFVPATAMTIGRAYAQAPAAAPAPPAGPFKQPPLPFLEPQLAPAISNRTVTLHYSRHHASYYTNLNNL